MATSITTQVASFSRTKTFTKKTDAEYGDILEWFIANTASQMPEGLTVAQQNAWKLDQVNDKIGLYIWEEAQKNRAVMLSKTMVSIQEQARLDTEL